ncbi:argonaute 5 [Ranunculus cassubicifolius]
MSCRQMSPEILGKDSRRVRGKFETSSSSCVSEIGSSSSSTTASPPVEQPPTLQVLAQEEVKFPTRPGIGTIGRKCVVKANHFLVQLPDVADLYHYNVSITPEVGRKEVNRLVINELISSYWETDLGWRVPVYDGRKALFTAGPLPFNSSKFTVYLVERNASGASTSKEREYKVEIKLAARTDLNQLQQFLQGRRVDAPQDTLQALDVVLKESPSNNYVLIGSSFFSPKLGQKSAIGDGVECWRGFYQSLRPTQMGLSLNIDVSIATFYEASPIIDFVRSLLNIRDISRLLSIHDCAKIKKALKGLTLESTHLRNIVRRRIKGISMKPTSHLMFEIGDQGQKVSVAQYFREKYRLRLQYAHWPSIQAGTDSRPIYLPMEVCKIVEGQKYSKKLNEKQITGMLRAACQRPNQRENNILKIVQNNDYDRDSFSRDFGIQVNAELASIQEARVLPAPVLKFHDNSGDVTIQPRWGQWNMTNSKFVNGGNVKYWAGVSFSTQLSFDAASSFCEEVADVCTSKGMTFESKPLFPVRSARVDQIENTLVDVHRQSTELLSREESRRQLQLLIIILPDVRGSYGKIKRICETELGLISQCCNPNHAMSPKKQYLENLALKINVKAGGRNTMLLDAFRRAIPIVTDRPTIIFGADVNHPSPGEDSSPSIASVVASMDWPEMTRYRADVSAQAHGEELIQGLYTEVQDPHKGTVATGMIREHLIAFRKSTGYKPERIIFYRDGVGEGQFRQVLFHELNAIYKACLSLEEGYHPRVTFIVVQKRHHTRLFPGDHNNRSLMDRSGNILPGTVVDTMICHPTQFDFYLCSHAGIQGTSRPTHYHVLWDENGFSADNLQTFTNNLCYTYARCTRSTSIVPPAYYAHLAAFRARYYIEGDSDYGRSSVGGEVGRTTEVRLLPRIKGNVKDVMFFC